MSTLDDYLKLYKKDRYFKREIEEKLMWWKENSDSSLEVLGARQVGKTTTLIHFASENFKNVIYINLSKDDYSRFVDVLRNTETILDRYNYIDFERRMREAGYDYHNSRDTVIVIDEIQLDVYVYNHIRIMTRSLESRLIVTGSYLARALYDKKFFIPAGDIDILEMTTLSFSEFLEVVGGFRLKDKTFEEMQNENFGIYGDVFALYMMFGGYPKVIERIIDGSVEKAYDELNKILTTFKQESKNYVEFIDDAYLIDNALEVISKLIFFEKNGHSNLFETIRNRINEKATNRISTQTCRNLIIWLYECGIIGFCGKCAITESRNGFNYSKYISERIYFKDLGVFNYYVKDSCLDGSVINGKRAENYMFTVIDRKLASGFDSKKQPMFAVFNDYEFDFFVIRDRIKYMFEIKTGDESSKSLKKAKEIGISDYYYYFGNVNKITIKDDSLTAPLYLAELFKFKKLEEDLEKEHLVEEIFKIIEDIRENSRHNSSEK